MAIEVEQKFLLTPEEEKCLLDRANFIEEQEIWDHYFDDQKFSLTSTDRWLRRRNGKWELKTPHNWPRTSTVRQYSELTTEAKIRKALNIPKKHSLLTDLEEIGIEQFALIQTTRRKFSKDGFGIDLDIGNLTPGKKEQDLYQIAEIELMVESIDEKPAAVEQILHFANQHGLETKHIRGKLLEYIRRYRPKHFQVLVLTGVVEKD